MGKAQTYLTKTIFILCTVITLSTYSCRIRCIKPACIIGFITAGAYMLYNDYHYVRARYNTYKIGYAREYWLQKILHNPETPSPDPNWWMAQHHQIQACEKTVAEYQKKALVSRIIGYLYSQCQKSKPFQTR